MQYLVQLWLTGDGECNQWAVRTIHDGSIAADSVRLLPKGVSGVQALQEALDSAALQLDLF